MLTEPAGFSHQTDLFTAYLVADASHQLLLCDTCPFFFHCALWTKLSLSKDTCAALSGSCGEAGSIEGQWCLVAC